MFSLRFHCRDNFFSKNWKERERDIEKRREEKRTKERKRKFPLPKEKLKIIKKKNEFRFLKIAENRETKTVQGVQAGSQC